MPAVTYSVTMHGMVGDPPRILVRRDDTVICECRELAHALEIASALRYAPVQPDELSTLTKYTETVVAQLRARVARLELRQREERN